MIAQALEANGATVYILGRRQEVLEKVASTAKHGNIHYLKTDVTVKSDLAAAVDHIASKSGYVNLVVANAGMAGPILGKLAKGGSPTELRDHFWSWDMNDFTQAFVLNNTAAFFTAVAFLELLDKGNKAGNVDQTSQVICVGSASGYSRVPYAGSKAAAVQIMKALATTLAPHDIRSNILAPGTFPSEMTAGVFTQDKWPRDFIPAQRVGDVKDMAGAILFLVSRAGAYANGSVLLTDGGRLSISPSTY
ncbi:hypothetical protein ACET3X_002137 [Alternaria dauci]|uniref:Uncharacterized protein n=1 Tax=Alternaria dauci TaxID=48095 RepID=A0ABR3UP44_9PLEO